MSNVIRSDGAGGVESVDDTPVDPISQQAAADASIPNTTVEIGGGEIDLTDLEDDRFSAIVREYMEANPDGPNGSPGATTTVPADGAVATGENGAGGDAGDIGPDGTPGAATSTTTTEGDLNGTVGSSAGDPGSGGAGADSNQAGLDALVARYGVTPAEAENIISTVAGWDAETLARVNAAVSQPRPMPAPNAAASGFGSPGVVAPDAAPGGVYQAPMYQQGIPAQGGPGATALTTPPAPDLSNLVEFAPGLKEWVENTQTQILTQQQQLAAYQAQVAQTAQIEQQNADRINREQMSQAHEEFKAKYSHLSPADLAAVEQRAIQMQTMPNYMRQMGHAGQAFTAAMETAMWSDPNIRNQAIQAQAAEQLALSQRVETRRQAAGSLSNSNGSVSRTPPAQDPKTMTPEQRNAAMIAEVASSIANR